MINKTTTTTDTEYVMHAIMCEEQQGRHESAKRYRDYLENMESIEASEALRAMGIHVTPLSE